MSLSEMLHHLHMGIENKRAEFDEMISRLKTAKSNIRTEQDLAQSDIKEIKKPALDSSWKVREERTFTVIGKKPFTCCTTL